MIEKEVCEECKGKLVFDHKEIWCRKCGLVEREIIDTGREMFDKDGDRIIISKPITLAVPINPTEIGKALNK